MKYDFSIWLSIIFLLTGCSANQASFSVQSPSSGTQSSISSYTPGDKEQFVFNKKRKSLQKYGYDNFCANTETFACSNTLPYDQYVGMKGYFVSSKPSYTDSYGHDFYQVVLSNGNKFYFVANNKYGGKYGSSSPIIAYKKYLEIKAFKPEPLIKGSDIQITGTEMAFGSQWFSLSNGEEVDDNKLRYIREITKYFGDSPILLKYLLNMEIKKDDMDNIYSISAKADAMKNGVRLYIKIKNNEAILRFRAKYFGDDWLFVKSIKVAADDFRWQSAIMEFNRDHSSGSVWEWVDIKANKEEIEVSKALAKAKKSIVRFQGRKYYLDLDLNATQKDNITEVLKLYSILIDV